MPIRNWAGAVLFAMGAWLLYAGLQRRRRALASWRAARAAGQTIDVCPSGNVAIGTAIIRPAVFILLISAGSEVVWSYQALGPSRVFSPFDLYGFLFMLLGYGIWFGIRTRYRDVTRLRVAPVPSGPG